MSALVGRNRRIALLCGAVVAAMVGLAYGSVPLYDLFCRVTGLGGTTQVADRAPGAVGERTITVRFNTDIAANLPWSFTAPANPVRVRIGEEAVVAYRAVNRSTKPETAMAVFNVTPEAVGRYFDKIQCFCFDEQTLQPGESVEMAVSFFIDPEILKDRRLGGLKEITLSYTLYRVDDPDKKKRPAKVAAAGKN